MKLEIIDGYRLLAKLGEEAVGGAGKNRKYISGKIGEKGSNYLERVPGIEKFEKTNHPVMIELGEILAERSLPRASMPALKSTLWDCPPYDLGNGVYYISESKFINRYDQGRIIRGIESSGIKRVIDLVDVREDFTQNGIEFSHIDMDSTAGYGFLCEPPFIDKSWYLERDVIGMSLSEAKRFRNKYRVSTNAAYDQLTKDYVERFVKFIQNMQKGNCLIRGYHDIDYHNLLALNKMFNPMAEKAANEQAGLILNEVQIYGFRELYKNLSRNDKLRMGWTDEFEARFLKLLAADEQKNIAFNKQRMQKWQKRQNIK